MKFERSTSNVDCTLLSEADAVHDYETDGNSSSDYSVDSSHMVGGNFGDNIIIDHIDYEAAWGESIDDFVDYDAEIYENDNDSSFGEDLNNVAFDFE